jgi:C4-dicarboxylate transporter DctM subunit
MVMQRLPHALGELLGPLAAHPALFLAVAIAIYLVFSGLLEGLPALLIFAPVLQPVANRAGIDPVHFGVVSIAALGIGFFLPPAGLGLSLSCTLANAGMGETMRRFWPYVLVLVAGLLLIAWVPAIALALPKAVLP